MKSDESVYDLFSKVVVIINKIRIFGEDIFEKIIIQFFKISLPSKFDHIIITIEQSKDLSICTQNELVGALLAHKERINR
ncbi:unnamed protein product [Spirodela intermedia]|uniref:Uncharacterized protein n=1 Tax=Spirodela intermedia TaxID=51605 RepID=A0A7I8J062_SPIIN|nr:unnamed protein product [Spirodela intermedia]CAA6662690.1 unnamed protein product [Spirodela intermedia]